MSATGPATVLFLLALQVATAAARPAAWVATWGAAPQPYDRPGDTPLSFSNQTIRQVARISVGGVQVRVRLSNLYGGRPVRLGSVHIALAGRAGSIMPGTDRVLTFGGRRSVTMPVGAPLVSDPVALEVPALSSVAVSLYIDGESGACSCHHSGLQTAFVSGQGDFTGALNFPAAKMLVSRPYLTEIDVGSRSPGKAIVALGDSITDGVGSSDDSNSRWPDRLAERLDGSRRGGWGVVNEGIGGNRLLHDFAGPSALSRFDQDVLAQPGAAYVIIFEGINDIRWSHVVNPPPEKAALLHALLGDPESADDLIGAYKQLIQRAHSAGLKVIGATITPDEKPGNPTPEVEADRQKINHWIRTGGAFDGVIDFDAVWRDPAHPRQIREELHSGDHLHGSDAGYRALADSIDLSLFR